MFKFQRNGYRSKLLATDIALGIVDGLDNSLWCYVYASIVFSGALAVYLPIGILSALLGWLMLSFFVTFTSKEPLHVANLDDQAVVIFGSISILVVGRMNGNDATANDLSTIMAVMGLTSLLFATCCYFVGQYRLSKLLDLLPFPVVCGFMASIGWLLLDAGVEVATGHYITSTIISDLLEGNRFYLLLISIICGAGLNVLLSKMKAFWVMPVALMAIVVIYYLVIAFNQLSYEEQLAGGWLFEIVESKGGVLTMLHSISITKIDWSLIGNVFPQILTIIFLAITYASMTLTGLKADSQEKIDVSEEFKVLGAGNILCAIACCPPGYTDVVSSTMYREFGASSRWMPLTSSFVGVFVLAFGASLITYMPKLLVTSGIFLFAFQTLYQWLYASTRGFNRTDYGIIWIILGTTIFAGFMQGILIGIILAILLFVIRYSMIQVIESRATIKHLRSSVERSSASNEVLMSDGSTAVIYSLQGFLFFGSANTILDTIVNREQLNINDRKAILIDMSRVTGVDISALNTFSQIKNICDNHDVMLMYSNITEDFKIKIVSLNSVSYLDNKPLFFDQGDFGIEFLEDLILSENNKEIESISIKGILSNLINNEEKVDVLMSVLTQVHVLEGEQLFSQGDLNNGFYIIESGSLSAHINAGGKQMRVRKFKAGSLVGELSVYLPTKIRSASVIADQNSIVYHLNLENWTKMDNDNTFLKGCLHELLATVLAERFNFMNKQLIESSEHINERS